MNGATIECSSAGGIAGTGAVASDIDFFLRRKNDDGFLVRMWVCSLGGSRVEVGLG